MPDHARVHSLEVLEHFRSRLLLYRERAARVIDEAVGDVNRTRVWLQQDRLPYWQREIRRLERDLERRKQELFSARLSSLRDSTRLEQAAVNEAKQALRDADDKLKLVRHYLRQFDHLVETPVRQVEKTRHAIDQNLTQAAVFLAQTLRTLGEYAEMQPAANPPRPTEPVEQPSTSAEPPVA